MPPERSSALLTRPRSHASTDVIRRIDIVQRKPELGPINQRFPADSVAWISNLAPNFTVDEISALQVALDAAMTEATAKGFEVPLDLMLRRLFEAAETGERDPEKLKAIVLAGWNAAKDSTVG